jgi:hypothetical protein
MSTDLPINLENPFPNPNEVKPAEKISPAKNFPEKNADDEAREKKKRENKQTNKKNLPLDSGGDLGGKIDVLA